MVRSILFFWIILMSFSASAQRPSSDFVPPCGLPDKGKFLPLIQDSIYYNDSRLRPFPDKGICLEADLICNNGEPLSLIQWLKDNPKTKVEIICHTDHRGDAASNKRLSQNRADNLRQWLISEGIEPSRLVANGKGEDGFLIPEATIKAMKTLEEQNAAHKINRRTEIRILEVNYKFWFGITDQNFFAGQRLDPVLEYEFNKHYDVFFNQQPDKLSHEQQLQRDSAFRVLNLVGIFLMTHPGIQLEIGVHTDQKDVEANNILLTRARADAIAKFLFEKGVKKEQLVAKGYGSSKPRNIGANIYNKTKQEILYSENRRVEFKIIKT